MSFVSRSANETVAFGQEISRNLIPGTVLCLFGDLGAGKTTLIKGIISGLTQIAIEEICSPTFAYLNVYEGKFPVYHFDLYRLAGVEDFLGMGFEDYLYAGGVCCVEWSERIGAILPKKIHKISLTHNGQEERTILYEISKS